MNRRIAILCALLLSSACGSDSGTGLPTVTSVVGTWKLTSVDGRPLPYVFQASDPKLELIAKQYVITSAGTYTSSFTLRGTELDGTVTTSTTNDAGTATLSGNTVQFTSSTDASLFFAEATTSTFTISGAVTQIFTKQ
ncbi:MAG: Lipocalin-like domain protein [Gemmatimonadetes bacterium]|jgi:hypothetical protein|nr:Lipocalin-like domain protein [Gemmatimonadota bacterium]